jgi:sugar O-acyltransferase (sialic acid O-acetyltransferase NeuD family)
MWFTTSVKELKMSYTRKLLLIGSSGHASVLLDAIELSGLFTIAGYVDDTLAAGTIRRGYSILGPVAAAASICSEQLIDDVVIAIGDNWWRRKVYEDLICRHPKVKFPVIKHPSSWLSASAEIGQGAAILACSHIGPGSRVGDFCIVNTGSSIDHDCAMLRFASIAPGVFTGGLVQIGECSAIGVGTSISDRISIGDHTVIGTGAVVVRNIPNLVVAYGNPARVKRSRQEGEKYVDSVGIFSI